MAYSKGYKAAAEGAHEKTGIVLATVTDAIGLPGDHRMILTAIRDTRAELAKIEQWLTARLADD